MAGESPLPVKPGRKQWKIVNGPITRIESLIDGTPDSQVVLGKKLLSKKCDDEEDEEENARLGVYWLIKASEQGHEEATCILKHCLETGKGIDGHNIGEVTSCLAMSQEEKVSRHAARELFASLSKGEDYITSDQLSEEMLRVEDRSEKGKSTTSGTNGAQRIDNNRQRIYLAPGRREKLTEDILVSAASRVARGELPLVHRTLTLEHSTDRHYHHRRRTLNRIGAFFTAPFRQIRLSYACLVDSLGQRPMGSFSPVTIAGLRTLFLVWLSTLVGLDAFLAALPTIAYFTSLVIMLISTCQVIAKKWESNHFKQWSNLLVAWGGDGVNAGEAQWAHCRKNITPYYIFLGSLLFNLTLAPFVGAFTIPHSEIVVLSTLCSGFTLYAFAWTNGKLDSLAFFSFGINLLARYPYETDAVVSQGWRFLDVHVPTFASYVVGSGVEFCLNFRLLFYLAMPVIFVRMSSGDHWRGFYTRLVPHCVALAWWQMAVIASNGATCYGLIRSCLALVGLVLFLPLAGLASVFLPVAAVVKLLTTERQLLPLSPSAAVALALLVTAIYIGRKQHATTARVINWIQVGLGILSAILLLAPILNPTPDDGFLPRSTPLTWSQYQRHCSNPPDSSSPMVITQERCATLTGLYVHWEGKLLSTRVSKIFNPLAVIVSKLPIGMQGIVTCMWGEHYEDCTKNKEECSAPPGLHNKCHLSKWNRYEYEIMVAMPPGVWRGEECLATLIADSLFGNFSRDVVVEDRIWFSGSLVGDQATGVLDPQRPRVYLHRAGCLTCRNAPSTVVNSVVAGYTFEDVVAALKSILNFMFNPLLIFK